MDFGKYQIESPDNFEQKSICCFVVDTSSSMQGEPIAELNAGLKAFHQDIVENISIGNKLEIAVVEFNSRVRIAVNPDLGKNFSMPQLSASGTTKMAEGIRIAIDLVEQRKEWYKETGQPYLRPWIILISDGEPDPDQNMDQLAADIERETKNKKFVFLPIGVRKADMALLHKISGYYHKEGVWIKLPPMKLSEHRFSEFFNWVSASMAVFASSREGDKIDLPDTSDWREGFEI
ncbi:MAG: VWA domain-containing protein [Phaeodactylibacter sp.]|nr:VWA domain-containing protein [Phaeodactylibacter sp.]MCB9299504.1 VWA domain-containing protein [Lewinellaceae bacterium]